MTQRFPTYPRLSSPEGARATLALTHPDGNWPHTTAIDQPTRVLLALTQADAELEEAAAAAAALPPAQAQHLLTLLGRQRLAPWVAYQLEQAGWLATLPEVLQSPLRQATARAKQRCARQRLALLHTVRCLRAAGLDAVALKGAQLAWQHYPQPWLRPMRDLDLLMPEEQIGPAFTVLEREGFQVRGESRKVRRADDRLQWHTNDFSLWHPSGDHIELHRSLWFRPGEQLCRDFSLEQGFWEADGPYRQAPDGDGISHLQPPYLALHCLAHHLLRHTIDMGPLGLLDLQRLDDAGHLNDPALKEACEQRGCMPLLFTAHTVLAGWRQTRWLTATTVPSWVLPMQMTPEQIMAFYLDHRTLRSHVSQWLAIQARGGRWSGSKPSRRRRLLNLIGATTLVPGMVGKGGVVQQIQRRLGQSSGGPPEGQLPPELVAATRLLQARTRGLEQGEPATPNARP